MAENTIIGSAAHVESMTVRRLMDLDDVTISSITRGDSPVYDSTTGNFINQSKGVFDVRDYGAKGDGVTDDTTAIQATIDAMVAAHGGIVDIPAGHYIVSAALEVVNTSNWTIQGAGIGATTINSSATAVLTHRTIADSGVTNHWAAYGYGTICFDTTVSGTTCDNVCLHDFTLKTSASDSVPTSQKPIFCGALNNCLVDRIKVDGARWEAIAHVEWQNPKISRYWRVTNCEVTNHSYSSVNPNNEGLEGGEVAGCYFHDGLTNNCAGVQWVGVGASIHDNIFSRLNLYGILTNQEAGVVPNSRCFTITNNHLFEMAKTSTGSCVCINVVIGGLNDGTVLIEGNTIEDLYDKTGQARTAIEVSGNVKVKNNVFRGILGTLESSKGISVLADIAGTDNLTVIEGNCWEPKASTDNCYKIGISIENDAHVGAVIRNNIMPQNSTRTLCLLDDRGAALLQDNLFYGDLSIGGVSYSSTNVPVSSWSRGIRVWDAYDVASARVGLASIAYMPGNNPYTLRTLTGGYIGQHVTCIATGITTVGFGLRKLAFTSGGTYEIAVSDTITGATSSTTAVVRAISLTSGTWAGGNAAGTLYVDTVSDAFQSENLNVGANSNVATIAGNVTLGTLRGNGGVNWVAQVGDSMACIYDGTDWYCTISDNTP